MIIEKTAHETICDTISCNKVSSYKILTYSYKGDMCLCSNCFKKLQNTLKRIKDNNELSKS